MKPHCGVQSAPRPPAQLMLYALAVPLIMFTPGITSIFYDKTPWDWSVQLRKVIIWYPSVDKTITRVQQFTKRS